MIVRVVLKGIYLNERLKAKVCAEGDTLETPEWYGERMIAEGQAERTEPEAEADAPAKKGKKKDSKKTPRTPGGVRHNPFLY